MGKDTLLHYFYFSIFFEFFKVDHVFIRKFVHVDDLKCEIADIVAFFFILLVV